MPAKNLNDFMLFLAAFLLPNYNILCFVYSHETHELIEVGHHEIYSLFLHECVSVFFGMCKCIGTLQFALSCFYRQFSAKMRTIFFFFVFQDSIPNKCIVFYCQIKYKCKCECKLFELLP